MPLIFIAVVPEIELDEPIKAKHCAAVSTMEGEIDGKRDGPVGTILDL